MMTGMQMQASWEHHMQARRARGVRFFRVLAVIVILAGLLMAALALSVFFGQQGEIQVTGRVLSKSCYSQYNPVTKTTPTICDAQVIFTARNGQVIQTKITGAALEDFSDSGLRGETIDIHYDPRDPGQAINQGFYLPVGQFIVMVAVGVGFLALGSWTYARARWLNERAAQRYAARRWTPRPERDPNLFRPVAEIDPDALVRHIERDPGPYEDELDEEASGPQGMPNDSAWRSRYMRHGRHARPW
jgi:hypothetical protein